MKRKGRMMSDEKKKLEYRSSPRRTTWAWAWARTTLFLLYFFASTREFGCAATAEAVGRQIMLRSPAAAAAAAPSPEEENEDGQQEQQPSSSGTRTTRSLALPLVAYGMPPFRVSFETPTYAIAREEEALPVGEDVIVNSYVRFPLKLITSEFLMESFMIQIAGMGGDGVPDTALDRLIRGLVKVNFDAEVRKVAGGDGDNSVFFVADFAGTATFPEPYYEKRGGEEEPGAATANATDITGEQVRNLLGGWTERAFLADLDVYRQYLRDSTEPILQHHTSLVVDTDPPPYDDGDGDIGQQAGTRASGGDTPLIVALAVVSAATAATLFFVVLPCLRGQRRCPGRPKGRPSLGCVGAGSLFKGQQLGGNCALDADAVLPGRRADGQDETDSSEDDPDAIVETSPASAAALQVLEASDRYLSKHRPDLFDAVKRASLSPSRKSGNSTSVFRDQHHLGDEHNHFGMELEDDFIDDEYYDEVALSDSFVPSSSWWNKLTSSLQAASPRDGSGRDGILVCDEDPSNYNFPFSDFPRTDGSPCLIYNESHTITHSSGNNSVAAGAALTNDQFQHQLEGQGQTDTSVESDDGGENKATEGFYEDDDESDRHLETPFTERLERLVAMRRRHYEKERLMERHRQARRLAEEQEAQRQRELKLRQHEMELDLEEIEASFSPTATANRRKSQLAAGDVGEHPMTVGDLGMFPPEAERESDLKFVGGETLPPIPSPPFISAKPPLSDGGDGSSNRSRRAPAPKKDGRSCNNTGVPVASSLREKGNRPITPVPMKRRRSHRRSSSHGTNLFADEKKTAEGGDHQYAQNHHQQQPIRRQGSFSNVDDAIMTFGIAAYTTKFV